MVTRTDMPSGPVAVMARSPLARAEFQPSGRWNMTLGATGSGTEARARRPRRGGSGSHRTPLGGLWWGSVFSPPGIVSAGSDGGGGAELVDETVPPVRMA